MVKKGSNTVERGCVHARAGVGDAQHDVLAWVRERLKDAEFFVDADVGGVNGERAAVGHRIAGIDAEIHEDLFHLHGIGAHEGEFGSEIRLDGDVAADHLFEKADGFDHGLIHVDIAWFEDLAAGEDEQLSRKRGGAVGLVAHLVEIAAEAWSVVGLFETHFGPAENRADHVVEIVSDASCELPDGFKFLRLDKLLFEGDVLGDVLDDHLDVRIGCSEPAPCQLLRRTVIALESLRFHSTVVWTRQRADLAMYSPAVQGIDVENAGVADGEEFGDRIVAEHVGERGIRIEEVALVGDPINPVSRVVHQAAIPGLLWRNAASACLRLLISTILPRIEEVFSEGRRTRWISHGMSSPRALRCVHSKPAL